MHRFPNTPLANAQFFLECIKLINRAERSSFEEELIKVKDKGIEFRLNRISEELKRLDTHSERAGYAIGTFYQTQNKTLTGSDVKECVEQAKLITKNALIKKLPQYKKTIRDYLANNKEDPYYHESQYANLCTDGAFDAVELINKWDEITLEEFYERHFESYKSSCKLQKDYIILMKLPEELSKIDDKQIHALLRKLTVTNPHEYIVRELLGKGADPTQPGEKSKKNALDLAQLEKLPKLIQIYEEHIAKQASSSSTSAETIHVKSSLTPGF